MRGEGGVAGEGKLVGVPKFHSWGKCTMPLTNINSDWMFNAILWLVYYTGQRKHWSHTSHSGPLFEVSIYSG